MITRAQREHGIDLTVSYMIGDKISDVEFGKKLGLKSVMVLTGYGIGEYEHQRQNWKVTPDFIAEDLLAAVNIRGPSEGHARALHIINSRMIIHAPTPPYP